MVLTPTPKAPPTPLPGLAAFLDPLRSLFRRPSTRESAERYCTGLLTDLPHKTCDGIAAAVAGTTTERLQHLLTDADWDPVALDCERVRLLVEATPAGGVLAIDDTTFPKQGSHSVGVAHQWCGVFGTQANCQALVTAEYVVGRSASAPAVHWPVSARLFLPKAWATTRTDDGVPTSRRTSRSARRWRAEPGSVPTLPEVHRRVVLALLTGLAAWWYQTGPPLLPPETTFALLGRAPPGR